MNKIVLIIIAIVIIASGAFVILGGDDLAMTNTDNNQVGSEPEPNSDVSNIQNSEQLNEEELPNEAVRAGSYVEYSDNILAESSDTNRVLFFHAPWCSTCNYFEGQIEEKGVPEGITVIKIDYDNEEELKSKYGVTIQSTFVQLDAEGNVLESWPFASGLRDIQDLYDAVI